MQTRFTVCLAASVLALAGCSAGQEGAGGLQPKKTPEQSSSASTPSPGTSLSQGLGTKVPDFPTHTKLSTGPPTSQSDKVLHTVRVGKHNGFDRLVIEFTGPGKPGWFVRYVKTPIIDPTGQKPRLRGHAFLDIYARGTTYPGPDSTYYDGPNRIDPDADAIAEVYVAGTFEGDTQVILGIDDKRRPFRVFALTKPARLVVDVKSD